MAFDPGPRGPGVAAVDGPKNENVCRDPKFLVKLAGETPAATARIIVNMLIAVRLKPVRRPERPHRRRKHVQQVLTQENRC